MLEDALPCPFCGSNDLRESELIIRCAYCGSVSPVGTDEADTLAKWNNRRDRNIVIPVLQKIARWDAEDFPSSGSYRQDGTQEPYGTAYGSNGQREHMRRAALVALLAIDAETPSVRLTPQYKEGV